MAEEVHKFATKKKEENGRVAFPVVIQILYTINKKKF